MRRTTAPLAVLCLIILAPHPSLAQASLLYRETAGSRQITNLMSEQILPDGYFLRSRLSDGDMHDVQLDRALLTIRYHVTSPARRIDYTVVRGGNVLLVDGILGGKPVSRRITIDGRPWYESLERSAHDFIIAGARAPLVFWVVNPWDANAYLLQARSEGREQVSVNGTLVYAARVRVVPVGILRFFWSALYWFRPDDGRFLRYEGVRGLPGTPKTIVELIDNG
jgi:hypothetical protein